MVCYTLHALMHKSKSMYCKILVAAINQIGMAAAGLGQWTEKLLELIRRAWANEKELRILITGKTGQGKSALVNGIIGNEVAPEGAGAERCTTKIDTYHKSIKDVPISVFDSPGLQDRTVNEDQYIQGMRDTCQRLSLVLYCTKMTNPRLTDDDKNAMMKLTEAFGEELWEHAVFVLTFSNLEDVDRKDERDPDESEPDEDDEEAWEGVLKRRFQSRVSLWENRLRSFLINEVKVSPRIADKIPVIPTGDYKKTRKNKTPYRLPDRESWFDEFWKTCCLRVKESCLFIKINSHRLVTEEEAQVKSSYNSLTILHSIEQATPRGQGDDDDDITKKKIVINKSFFGILFKTIGSGIAEIAPKAVKWIISLFL